MYWFLPSFIRRVFVVAACCVVGVTTSNAALLLYEPFAYTDGPLVSVSGGTWTTHSGTNGQIGVISGRVDLRVPDTEDVNALVLGQPYPATTNVILYASFTVNYSSLPTANGAYFIHFKGTGTAVQRAKVYALTAGAGVGQYRFGLANGANTAAIATAASFNTNVDYRIYVRYVVSNATSTLWVNPTNEASPSITATDIVSPPGTITSLALRQDTGIGVLQIDDLQVGTSFADVYTGPNIIAPIISQHPVSTSAIEGGAATFIAAATGTAPLSFQWKFNNAPISGATNTSLTLLSLTTNAAGQYSLTVTNAAGSATSSEATLKVIQPNASGTLSLVHYNVKGNFASDWSTNAAQVQAIARQLRHLNPDIIALNEIPNGLKYEMTNWMTAFFPTYQLAISPGTDGVLRSGVISRFPITRSQSWLENASLTNFGYAGTYTRDLFEAEITVPGATEPLHVFTTHLKSAADVDAQQRRAAECSAVSNFFVNVFIPTNGNRPYLLTGDLNEDIALPMSQNLQAIQRLTNTTGLKLTTPLNPFTLTHFTHSIQGSLDARFDYVMPAGLLYSNILASQVFRTDLLPPPLPLNVNSNDDIVASDHLPVVMVFNYPDPPLLTSLSVSNQTATLTWPALIGRKFSVLSSTNLTTWTMVASNLVSLTPQATWSASASASAKYFRVVRTQ
jgi:endonuclease/exonuclease/phosphatase family metal-dependent hydrolase